MDNAYVSLDRFSVLELFGKFAVSDVGLGDNEDACRVPVEAMDYARPKIVANTATVSITFPSVPQIRSPSSG